MTLAEELAERVYKEFGSPICKPLNRDDADDCRAAILASQLVKFITIEPIKGAINEAIERAAQEADLVQSQHTAEGYKMLAQEIAASIRKLKSEG